MLIPLRDRLMTSFSRSTTSTPAFVAGDRVAVLVLLAPKFYLFFLCALYSPLSHLPVVLYFRIRKFSILPEYDVEIIKNVIIKI